MPPSIKKESGSNRDDFERLFPFLENAGESFRKEFETEIRRQSFAESTVLVNEQDRCQFLPVVVLGELRVYKSSPGGREITLYRIEPGESCILTTFSILNERPFPATASVKPGSEVLFIPATVFHRWMHDVPLWRNYVFQILEKRLFSTLITVSEVVFRRTDSRLLDYLLRRSTEERPILNTTHQEIANDLGTAREVVNRILRDLEKSDIIRLSRGTVEILDRRALEEKMESFF